MANRMVAAEWARLDARVALVFARDGAAPVRRGTPCRAARMALVVGQRKWTREAVRRRAAARRAQARVEVAAARMEARTARAWGLDAVADMHDGFARAWERRLY